MTRTIEVEQVHNGLTIRRVREGNSRFYEVDGVPALTDRRLPGTSNCLDMLHKPALVPWANRMGREAVLEYLQPYVDRVLPQEALAQALTEAKNRPDQVKRASADYGTRAHALIAQIVVGGKVEVPEDLRPAVDSFYRWYEALGGELRLAEVLVCSAVGYATQIDGIVGDGEKVEVVNLKTGGGPYLEHALQAAAEARAYWSTFGVWPKRAWVVRLAKDTPRFEAHAVADLPGCFEAFERLLRLWEWEKRQGDNLWLKEARNGKP